MQTAKQELEESRDTVEIDTGIWNGPESSISYLDCHDQQNDLREKLNNSSVSKSFTPKVSTVQFRMMAPNNASNRPRGIPTLLPLDVQVNNRKWTNGNGNRRYRGNRGNRNYNNFQRGFNDDNVGHGNTGVSNGRVQKNRKQDFERFGLFYELILKLFKVNKPSQLKLR